MRTWIIAAISAVVIVGILLVVNFWPAQVDEEPAAIALPQAAPEPVETPVAEQAAAPVVPSFDVVRVGREGTGVIAGRAAGNAEVTIKSGARVIGTAVANRNGEWVLIFDEPLDTGTQELSLSATVGGASPVESENVVIVSIPERDLAPPGKPETEGVIAVLAPRKGGGVSRILQKPGMVLEESLDRRLLVETIDYDDSGRAQIAGKTAPRAEVRLYLDNAYIGVVSGDDSGRWTFSPEQPISSGPHTLRLDQIFEGDDVEIRIEQPFDRESPLDVDLAEGHVVVRAGNNLWSIARRIYGAGMNYTVIYRANQDQIRDPDLIYPGQQFALPPRQAPGQ